jgi:hypothetical protein
MAELRGAPGAEDGSTGEGPSWRRTVCGDPVSSWKNPQERGIFGAVSAPAPDGYRLSFEFSPSPRQRPGYGKCSFYGVMVPANGRMFVQRRSTVAPPERNNTSDEVWRKALLVCGVASSLLYALMIWGIRYDGYSPISQVPSELTAIGAPTRALWARLGWIYTVLVTAFGVGVWKSAGGGRALRIVGGLILAHASLGLLWPFAAMHQREVLAAGGGTLSDTLHVVLGAVTVFLMFLAIGFGAFAFGKPFRLYSIATIVVLLTFGALTFLEAPRLQANQPTPWIGLWERINISVFLLWIVMLADALWRTRIPRRAPHALHLSVEDSGG